MEPVVSSIFHIHVDGKRVSPRLINSLRRDLNFFESNFSGSPRGYKSAYPRIHLTCKHRNPEVYKEQWKRLIALIDANKRSFKGYLEGEYIDRDDPITDIPFDDSVPFPFSLETRKLNPQKGEFFRETEFHLCFDEQKSDSRIIKKMLKSGMMPVQIDKGSRGKFIIFTSQGYKQDITELVQMLRSYLSMAGGTVNCTIKEEEIRNYKLYRIDQKNLPEIVAKVHVG